MGFTRKALFTTTFGVVAPNSKKQRVALQTLAAVQGKSAAEVGRTGTRREIYRLEPRREVTRDGAAPATRTVLAWDRGQRAVDRMSEWSRRQS